MKEYVKSTSQLVTTNLKIKNLIQQSLYIVTAKAYINGLLPYKIQKQATRILLQSWKKVILY